VPGRFVCAAAFAFCLASAGPAGGQEYPDRPVEQSAFELSVSQEFGEGATQSVVVTASIPYRRLVFFFKDRRYEARYRVYLELKGKHGKSAPGGVWEETVVVDGYRETTSAAQFAATRRTFPVDPGEYTITVTIEVIGTSRRFKEEQALRVVGGDDASLVVANPVFYTRRAEDSLSVKPRDDEIAVSVCPSSAEAGARANPGGVYGDFGGWARVVFGVVAPPPIAADSLVLAIRVLDARGAVARTAKKPVDLGAARRASLCVEMNLDDLPIDEYEIEAVLETADGARKSRAAGRFTVLFNAGLLSRPDDLVALLSLAGDEKAARAVAGAPAADRLRAWSVFWRSLDPTSSTESNEAFGDFLQRLKYTLAAFSKHKPGWRTDMGKIYIEHGPPDKVEDRQTTQLGGNYQLWYYYSKGVVYIFEDMIGAGDYHLLSTEMM
jgi:GWxTD domain-containing protein